MATRPFMSSGKSNNIYIQKFNEFLCYNSPSKSSSRLTNTLFHQNTPIKTPLLSARVNPLKTRKYYKNALSNRKPHKKPIKLELKISKFAKQQLNSHRKGIIPRRTTASMAILPVITPLFTNKHAHEMPSKVNVVVVYKKRRLSRKMESGQQTGEPLNGWDN